VPHSWHATSRRSLSNQNQIVLQYRFHSVLAVVYLFLDRQLWFMIVLLLLIEVELDDHVLKKVVLHELYRGKSEMTDTYFRLRLIKWKISANIIKYGTFVCHWRTIFIFNDIPKFDSYVLKIARKLKITFYW
jgi:hypothetical protein